MSPPHRPKGESEGSARLGGVQGESEDDRGFSLRRWSARKHAALAHARDDAKASTTALPTNLGPAGDTTDAEISAPPLPPAVPVADANESTVAARTLLPPIDSLTRDSDFTPFMQPGVAPELRSAALHKLFADPHFNMMDGLDVYIDDYSKPDPIAPDIVKTLNHARFIFAPPKTRVNDQGEVEDLPPAESPPAKVPAPAPLIADATNETASGNGAAPEQIPIPLDPPPGEKP